METAPPFSEFPPETLNALLRRRALQQPDRRGYTFLPDGEGEARHLTYGELDRQARRIAALLQSRCGEGERALLLYPPGLDYIAAFFGSLYAGVIAVPAYPPRNDRALPRLQAIIQDAGATLLLGTEAVLSKMNSMFTRAPELRLLKCVATDASAEGGEPWRDPAVDPDRLAFLQYTSGSTGTPKGVMLTHRNVLHNEAAIYVRFGHSPESVVVTWLPMYHDMGLIGGMLQPLYAGIPCILMAPASFIQRPIRWLQAISNYRATTSGGPNFAYDHCIRNIPPEQRGSLDLSGWQLAFNGAEPVRRETMARFAAAFEPCGFRPQAFYPCYGLAEASLIVSGGRKGISPKIQDLDKGALEQKRAVPSQEGAPAVSLVGCGESLDDQRIVIADPERGRRCLPGEIGEIWVSGPSIAKGYWSRSRETGETFRAFLSDTGEGPFLRTGDLGFLQEGVLFVTGRLKDLIVIQGRNHYPQDIERTVERSAPIFRPGGSAAFSVEADGNERLVVVQEVDFRRKPDERTVGAVRLAVAREHELEAYAVVLIQAGTLPKTSSGKTQRRLCRSRFLAGDLEKITEWRAVAEPERPLLEGASKSLAGGAL